jgi:hypothetical protein
MIYRRPRGRRPKGVSLTAWDHSALNELWERALASENGIAIKSYSPESLKVRLHKARHESGHHRFDDLAIEIQKGEVWIKRRMYSEKPWSNDETPDTA